MSSLTKLTEDFIDGRINDQGIEELQYRLSDKEEGWQEAMDIMEQHTLLNGLFSDNSVANGVMEKIRQKHEDLRVSNVMDKIRARHHQEEEPAAISFKRIPVYLAAAAALILSFVILKPANTPEVIAKVSNINGVISLIRDGESLPLTKGMEVLNQDILLNEGSGTVKLNDNSEVTVYLDTELKLKKENEDWLFLLSKGKVMANVTPQKGQFRVVTNDLEVSVVGTQFTVSKMNEVSHLKVFEGKVRAQHKNGEPFLLTANQEFKVNQDKILVEPREITEVYRADFEKQIPEGDLFGQVLPCSQLPPGNDSEFAVKATKTDVNGSRVIKGVYIINQKGIFTYKENMVIRFKYWMNPNCHWLGVFMRSDKAKINIYGSNKATSKKWQIAEFPIEEITPKNKNKELKIGDVISRIHIMTHGSDDSICYIDDIQIIQK